MNKGSHFIGQPAYGQLINLLDRTGILDSSFASDLGRRPGEV